MDEFVNIVVYFYASCFVLFISLATVANVAAADGKQCCSPAVLDVENKSNKLLIQQKQQHKLKSL